MNDPKGQHFLPSVYLRGFCNEAGKLHLYDPIKKEFRSNIKPEEIAKKKHLYTIILNGVRNYGIEHFFNELEAKYGAVMSTMKDGNTAQLTEDDFWDIILFISFLYARNLSKVNKFSNAMEKFLSSVGNGLLNYNLREQGEEYLRPLLQIKPNKNYMQQMTMLTMTTVAETMFNLLTNEGDWFFCIAGESSEFITTDDPMENMVMIPLSRKILFMRVTEKIPRLNKRVQYVTPQWVNNINCKIASSAKRAIFASSREIIRKEYLRMNSKEERWKNV